MRSTGKTLLWIAGIGLLVLLPAAGGKIFNAVASKLDKTDPPPIELKDIKSAPAKETRQDGPAKRYRPVPEEDAEAAKDRYLQGLKYFQGANYEKAEEAWLDAADLDPNNQDIRKGLKRIEALNTEDNPE